MATYVTGTTAIGIRYKDGVLLASDKALSYGKMHLSHDYCRIQQMTEKAALVFSGDEADMKDALNIIKNQVQEQRCNDLPPPSAKAIHGQLSLQNYEKRNDSDPYMNNFLIAGPNFLGIVDLFGTNFETNFYATSLGKYYCLPLIRDRYRPDMTKEQAHEVVKDCIKVMWNNDCLAEKKYDVWFVTKEGIEKVSSVIQDDFSIAAHKDLAAFV
ncbi:Proteasome_subunit beta type [Hexamita inflata]|uniref:Proteasome subunit beta n=1 Tax=Hexamita inflata TaxID=28002 RepID=A0AA86P559_9EUKA|nr:Proteasome subunit beta type [Hexamita inflata]CAI9931966.1 Proteasome subunit beta type [Hexamita inflata]CAI9944347.1 Proteasome subunit beta type [Hexamita inflata]CAI9968542.1 Proteasome subunit beta type [Hexamita inflata]CAI9969345.1 Proteasome subunit beta type [Hexamita inflata]